MSESKIIPERITKPIQLLAAWLAGLILVNGSFLAAAVAIAEPEWVRSTLVVACVVNVPLFLACLFLLQTKFRPEMQEDTFYSKYLEQHTGKIVSRSPIEDSLDHLRVEISESNQRYVEMISGLDTGLKALAIQLNDAQPVEDKPRSRQLSELADEVNRSAKFIERAREKASDAAVMISVNDLLPEFKQISRDLWSSKLSVDKTFGSTSKEPEVPKFRIIGFGPSVPMQTLRQVVNICRKYGFDRIHFTTKEFNAGSIYIGSYIYRAPHEPQPVPLDEELHALINRDDADAHEVIAAIEAARA